MAKKPLGIQVIEEADERFLVKTFGSEERQSIVKVPRKKRPRQIDWSRKYSSGLKRGFLARSQSRTPWCSANSDDNSKPWTVQYAADVA
jgi:hypothetical protein